MHSPLLVLFLHCNQADLFIVRPVLPGLPVTELINESILYNTLQDSKFRFKVRLQIIQVFV